VSSYISSLAIKEDHTHTKVCFNVQSCSLHFNLTHNWIFLFMVIRQLGVAVNTVNAFVKFQVSIVGSFIYVKWKKQKSLQAEKNLKKTYLTFKMDTYHRLLSPATERISFNRLHHLRLTFSQSLFYFYIHITQRIFVIILLI